MKSQSNILVKHHRTSAWLMGLLNATVVLAALLNRSYVSGTAPKDAFDSSFQAIFLYAWLYLKMLQKRERALAGFIFKHIAARNLDPAIMPSICPRYRTASKREWEEMFFTFRQVVRLTGSHLAMIEQLL